MVSPYRDTVMTWVFNGGTPHTLEAESSFLTQPNTRSL